VLLLYLRVLLLYALHERLVLLLRFLQRR
jgi:hypothetical protein